MKRKLFAVLATAGMATAAMTVDAAVVTRDAAWEQLRETALNRHRRIIYNTDGCDTVYFPRKLAATKENLAARRLRFTCGTAVDTISYNVVFSFGKVIYNSKSAELLLADPPQNPHARHEDPNARNVTKELIAQGTDPLQVAIEFCRAENREIFASIRCNDVHDQVHTAKNPFWLMSEYKLNHPQLLLGSQEKRPPYCVWSAVDYGQPEIREHFKQMIAELCAYDIDGLELDFMRHPQLLKSVANGGHASNAELTMLTNFMKEVRAIAETAGRKRGCPILIAIRVPDSVGYCRAIGIDLENWMKNKVFDIMIGGGYFQLNPWETSVKLAAHYGIKFYASLDDSRIERSGVHYIPGRQGRNFLLARTAAALAAGCDGVYHFNLEYDKLYDVARTPVDQLAFVDKNFYATERGSGGYHARQFVQGGADYEKMTMIDPGENPPRLQAGETLSFPLLIPDDLTAPEARRRDGKATICMLLENGDAQSIGLTVNGKKQPVTAGDGGMLYFELAPGDLRRGENRFSVTAVRPVVLNDFCVQIRYAKTMPERFAAYAAAPIGQTAFVGVRDGRLYTVGNWQNSYRKELLPVQGNVLRMVHNSDRPDAQSMCFILKDRAFLAHPPAVLVVEWKMRVAEAKPGEPAFQLTVGPARPQKGVWENTFYFSKQEMSGNACSLRKDFTRFHTFRLALDTRNGEFVLWVDGEYSGTGVIGLGGSATAPYFHFGDGSGRVAGCTELEYVTVGTVNSGEFAPHAAQPVEPVASVEVKDGKPCVTGKLRNDYRPGLLKVAGNALELIHDSNQPGADGMCFVLKDDAFLSRPPEITAVEWRSRITAANPDDVSFQLSVGPGRPDKGAWENNFRFSGRQLTCDAGVIPGDFTRFHTFRLLQNTRSGEYAFYIDGQYAAGGMITQGAARPAAFINFGDGSGRVAGRAELEYLKIGTVK